MKCPYCGEYVKDGDIFCHNCDSIIIGKQTTSNSNNSVKLYEQIPFTEASQKNILDKIRFLEELLGKNISFKMMNPEPLYGEQDVNRIASNISDFLGFFHKPVSVVFSSKEPNIGGNIVEEADMVFIEINNTIMNRRSIIAVLAHEIMHHYLNNKDIRIENELENEILTDVATIYVGLGKLCLNGIYTVTKYMVGNKEYIHTQNTGYLDRRCFNFAYFVIGKLRDIPEKLLFEGLDYDATTFLKDMSRSESINVLKPFFEKETMDIFLNKQCKYLIKMGSLLKLIESNSHNLQKPVSDIVENLRKCSNEVNPVLKKLNSLCMKRLIIENENKYNEFSKKVIQLLISIENKYDHKDMGDDKNTSILKKFLAYIFSNILYICIAVFTIFLIVYFYQNQFYR